MESTFKFHKTLKEAMKLCLSALGDPELKKNSNDVEHSTTVNNT